MRRDFGFFGHLLENILLTSTQKFLFYHNNNLNFRDVSNQYLLKYLVLILVCRETKGCGNHITLVEPARRQTAQHSAHILVFEPSTHLAQYYITLLDGTTFGFRRLHAKGLALAHNS